MHHLGLLVTLVVLTANLWGGALAVGWFLRSRWFALAVAPLLWMTVWFAVETWVGLGGLRWLLGLSSLASLALLRWVQMDHEPESASAAGLDKLRRWREHFCLSAAWPTLAVFAGLLLYALAWRWAFPDIDGSSEKLSDLSYIASYVAGERIPVVDAWLHPYPSIHYYSFQHYAAAHLARMFGWSVGFAYNLSFCLLVALAGTAFTGILTFIVERTWVRAVALACFVLGGSGAAGIVHWVYQDPAVWNGNRFIGSSRPYDVAPLGDFLQKHAAPFVRTELPGEPFAYTIFLGDYHPPLASFYLLGVCAMGMALWHRTHARRYALLVGACQTWIVLGNTWIFPLQAGAVFLWWLFERENRGSLLSYMLVGAFSTWLLAYGFLHPFLLAAQDYNAALRLVPGPLHTPPLLFVLYLLPTLAVFIGGLYSGKRAGLWLGLGGLGFLAFSEFFYLDDVYSGEFERFNSSLKWWPWITSVGILAGAWVIDQASRRWLRYVVLVLMAYPLWFGVDLAVYWVRTPKTSAGKWEGNEYLRRVEATRILLNRLSQEPRGVVAERPNKDSYTNSACLPLFAGHRLWLGWVGHEALWRGYSNDIWQRQDALLRLFGGTQPKAGEWLVAQGVDYVLWYQEADTNELWETLAPQLEEHFLFKDIFVTPEGRKVGYWLRRSLRRP